MDFGDIAGKAGELLNQHGDKVEDAVEKVGELAKDKFGHADQVDMAVDKIKDLIPDGPGQAPAAPAGE